ncbi:chromosome partitioning protein ParB, partial [Enterococcus faecalis]
EFLKAYNYKLHRNSNKAIKYEIEIDGKPVIRDIQSMFLIKEIKNG